MQGTLQTPHIILPCCSPDLIFCCSQSRWLWLMIKMSSESRLVTTKAAMRIHLAGKDSQGPIWTQFALYLNTVHFQPLRNVHRDEKPTL